jgi:transitional endoplasmic reticulum ATPase
MIGISNLVTTGDNVAGRNNPDHNASHETTTGGDKGSRDSGDKSRVEKTSLKVAEANSKDVGRRIARIDPKVSEELGLLTGDVVEISSEKGKVSVLNWPSYQQDYGKGLIRIDGYVRTKLDVGVNDKVEIRKIVVKNAKSITLAPTCH